MELILRLTSKNKTKRKHCKHMHKEQYYIFTSIIGIFINHSNLIYIFYNIFIYALLIWFKLYPK
jgi:hypothetical protein